MSSSSAEHDLVPVRLHPNPVDEDNLHSIPIVGLPLHGVDRLAGVFGDPVLVGSVGPEDPAEVHGIVRHQHPRLARLFERRV